ncbi:MAG TPA: helix-turn-helix domain-containing protein [Pyrinomonadaceae bacterium]|nr:helix-turn-helix domain-containing protein [Pyrinomonadaceae bacterium]
MKICSHTPQNLILKDLIRCVYVLEHDENAPADSFLILPSVSSYLSVSQKTKSFTENEVIIVEPCEENLLDSSFQSGLKSSCIYEYRGKVKEICVVFNPLAIYDFFDEEILTAAIENKRPFLPDENYRTNINRILNITDNARMLAELEDFLLSRHRPFRHSYLRQAVEKLTLMDEEDQITLEELAKSLKITRQTLNHQFKKYLDLSASEFKQICRFRKFIQAKLIDENNSRLTDLVYNFGFFDQSHLIKEFKKYTFLKPRDFFKKVDCSKDNQIIVIWQ